MSLSAEPDFQDYIVRIADILKASALVFPKLVGGDDTKEDLVNQIILNELPIPQMTIEGPGPPHIFISQSETPIVSQEQQGRDSRDAHGGRRMTIEIYVVIISGGTRSRAESDSALFNIISAVTTTLGQNMRLAIPTTLLSPLAFTHTYNVVPYIFDITQTETTAKNVVIRPVIAVNLR